MQLFNYSYGDYLARANAYIRRTTPEEMIESRTSARGTEASYSVAVGEDEPTVLISGQQMMQYRFAFHRFTRACIFLAEASDESELLAQSNRTLAQWTAELDGAAQTLRALFSNKPIAARAEQRDCRFVAQVSVRNFALSKL